MKQITESVLLDTTKTNIIFESLANQEDKKYLRGVTSFESQMNYLKQKHNKSSELVSNELGKAL